MVEEILRLSGVKAYYYQNVGKGHKEIKAVDGVDLAIYSGEVLGIVGESGSGKSTLANVLMMNVSPPLRFIEGEVVLRGRDGAKIHLEKMSRDVLRKKIWGTEMALVPQASMNALMPTLRLRRIARDILRSHFDDIDDDTVVELAVKALTSLGLPADVVDRYPFELSGGMRQRAVLAMATILRPRILIADEPTSALDVSTQKVVVKTMFDMKSKGIIEALAFISHDIATVRQIADRMIVMYAGKIVELGRVEDIIKNPLHPYTKGLIESVLTPEPEVRRRGLRFIPGFPPDLSNPPPGCRFHPRCPFAMEICRRDEPRMIEAENGHHVACWLYPGGGHARG
ncbi:MAG: ABC transporter ATP-binding protein [Desulfurococcales archaeon]|jgi:peptide/nickel transport system ATP-binding protein|nr:ABC transporter ATP-binding protein [Desulfurococcales archaeon]